MKKSACGSELQEMGQHEISLNILTGFMFNGAHVYFYLFILIV